MNARAFIIALLGAVFIATVGYFNDKVPRLNHFVGNHFPIIVFFPLMLVAGLLNPLLGRLRPRWRLARAELAIIVALLLVACNIPGSGLLRFFSRGLVMPIKVNHTSIAWKKGDVLSYLPTHMLANDGRYDESFVLEAYTGQDGPIGLGEVPWAAWAGALTMWLPLVVLFGVGTICLALMVHRAWSTHERLPYPVAQLAGSLMETDERGRVAHVFRRRGFWAAAAIIFAVHVVNGAYVWTDEQFIQVPLVFDFYQIVEKWPSLAQGTWWRGLVHVAILPTVVAFACFVNKDVSFTIGISAIPFWLVGSTLVDLNIPVDQGHIQGGVFGWQMAGSFIAIALTLIYLGRRYYLHLFRVALALGPSGEVRDYEVWACRVFLLCMAGLTAILVSIGLDWPIAILAVILIMLGYLVFGRICAESGLILIQTWWQPVAVLIGIFGIEALGLKALAMVGMLCVVFSFDRRECLMPFILNGLRVCDLQKVPTGRVGAGGVAVFAIALAAAVPFSLWVDHSWGLKSGHGWATNAVPSYTFNYAAGAYTQLQQSGQLESSRNMSSWQRVMNVKPDSRCLAAMGLGAAGVLVLSALRLRYTWWPIHPILLLVWGTWGAREVAYSFLLGWFIKRTALKFGVRWPTLRTFMIGVIAGDLLGGALWMVVGAIFYGLTGQNPPRYHIFPGG